MPGWIRAFRAIPWVELLAAAPVVAKGARNLWATVSKREAPPAVGAAPDDRHRALDAQIEELRRELTATSELVTQLADQNSRLVEAVAILRVRTRVLMAASAALAVAV